MKGVLKERIFIAKCEVFGRFCARSVLGGPGRACRRDVGRLRATLMDRAS